MRLGSHEAIPASAEQHSYRPPSTALIGRLRLFRAFGLLRGRWLALLLSLRIL